MLGRRWPGTSGTRSRRTGHEAADISVKKPARESNKSIILESDYVFMSAPEKLNIILSRLAAIEDILGDEYDLDRLRELVEADREGRCVVLPDKTKVPALEKGAPIWYVDCESGVIELGEISLVSYKNGELDTIDVDFAPGGPDEFFGSAWGDCLFGSREEAIAALRPWRSRNE